MPPLVPLVTNTSRSGWPSCAVDFALQLLPQDRHALRQGIAVLAAFDRGNRRTADRFRRLEIGLANGEIDRIGEFRPQIENLADSRGIEETRAIGEPVCGHGKGRKRGEGKLECLPFYNAGIPWSSRENLRNVPTLAWPKVRSYNRIL